VALLQIKLRSDFSQAAARKRTCEALQAAAPILRDEALVKPGYRPRTAIADLVDTRFAQPSSGAARAEPPMYTPQPPRADTRRAARAAQLPPAPARGPPLHRVGRRSALARVLLGLLLPAVLAAVEIAVRTGVVPAQPDAAANEIVGTLAWLAHNGLAGHLAASTLRVAAGFGIGGAAPCCWAPPSA
jgi:hypothetical protein